MFKFSVPIIYILLITLHCRCLFWSFGLRYCHSCAFSSDEHSLLGLLSICVSNKNVGNNHKTHSLKCILDLFPGGMNPCSVAPPLPSATRSTTKYNKILVLTLTILNSACYSNVMVLYVSLALKVLRHTFYAHVCVKLFEYRNSAPHTLPVIVNIKFQYEVKKALVNFILKTSVCWNKGL